MPVAQMGALSDAFFRRKYLFSVEESYQTVPELQHAQRGITAAHVPNQLQLRFRMLVRVAVGTPGPAGQGFHTAVPTALPEVDIRPALVILSAGPADTVFRCVFHQGLPIRHVLCYTFAHEGYGLLSPSCCVVTQL